MLVFRTPNLFEGDVCPHPSAFVVVYVRRHLRLWSAYVIVCFCCHPDVLLLAYAGTLCVSLSPLSQSRPNNGDQGLDHSGTLNLRLLISYLRGH